MPVVKLSSSTKVGLWSVQHSPEPLDTHTSYSSMLASQPSPGQSCSLCSDGGEQMTNMQLIHSTSSLTQHSFQR